MTDHGPVGFGSRRRMDGDVTAEEAKRGVREAVRGAIPERREASEETEWVQIDPLGDSDDAEYPYCRYRALTEAAHGALEASETPRDATHQHG